MKYRALVSFTGSVSMAGGEVREISDLAIANDLLKVKYIEEVKASETSEKKAKSPKRKENTK